MFRPLVLVLGLMILLDISDAYFSIRKLETLTSTIPGSGMDGPSIHLPFFGYSNGGTYSITICNQDECCKTGTLNNADNNWETGQADWFVGSQIQDCYRFNIDNGTEVKLLLSHTGSNAGLLEYVRIHSWHTASSYLCPIQTRLDYTTSFATECQYEEHDQDQDETQWCNGSADFCELRFNQFLFPGTHNSGTGMADGVFECASKNQDLSITEQLEFGIRFFDLDVIFSDGLPGCDGLETGHGAMPEVGLYQCYGQIEDLLNEVTAWLEEQRSEVVILYFGGIGFKETTVPVLVNMLKDKLEKDSGLRLNSEYKESGVWPTLGSAVQEDARLFVFVRDSRVADEKSIVEDIKVKPKDDVITEKTPGAASIITSYKAGSVGSDCSFVLNTTIATCSRTDTDFVKVSIFSSYFKKGVSCLWDMAKVCNKLTDEALDLCSRSFQDSLQESSAEAEDFRFAPNFLLLDYPNYQGELEMNFIQICQLENYQRVKQIRLSASSSEILD